jgi:hypothetical protein
MSSAGADGAPQAPAAAAPGPKVGKSGKRICCSCPDTKRLRCAAVACAAADACRRHSGARLALRCGVPPALRRLPCARVDATAALAPAGTRASSPTATSPCAPSSLRPTTSVCARKALMCAARVPGRGACAPLPVLAAARPAARLLTALRACCTCSDLVRRRCRSAAAVGAKPVWPE